jgi:hypothetical protein
LRRLLAAIGALTVLVASALFAVSATPAGASPYGWHTNDGVESIGYGYHQWWGQRESQEYSFIVDITNYCGHPETGRTDDDCQDVEVTGRIHDWGDYETQVFYAQMPRWMALQAIWATASGGGPARIQFLPSPYAPDGSIGATFTNDTGQEGCGPDAYCGWWGDAFHYSYGSGYNYYAGVTSYCTCYALAWNQLYFSGQGWTNRAVIVLDMWLDGGLPLPPADPS